MPVSATASNRKYPQPDWLSGNFLTDSTHTISRRPKKHNVTIAEVKEAIQNINAHRKGYAGRILLIGRAGKRTLAIVVALKENSKYYPVTVRDADKKERRLLHDNEEE